MPDTEDRAISNCCNAAVYQWGLMFCVNGIPCGEERSVVRCDACGKPCAFRWECSPPAPAPGATPGKDGAP